MWLSGSLWVMNPLGDIKQPFHSGYTSDIYIALLQQNYSYEVAMK